MAPRQRFVRGNTRRCQYRHGSTACGLTLRVGLGIGFCISVVLLLAFPQPPAPAQVICFGDSHTRGVCGAPWVVALSKRLNRSCENRGANGETVAAVTRRIPRDMACTDAVVLVGTNDALLELAWRASSTRMVRMYLQQNRMSSDYTPSASNFGAAYRRLLASVPARRIVATSLPPIGGSLSGVAAEVIADYNKEIRAAVELDRRVVYAPFFEALRPALLRGAGTPFDGSASCFSSFMREMTMNMAARALPFGSFDRLARLRGRSRPSAPHRGKRCDTCGRAGSEAGLEGPGPRLALPVGGCRRLSAMIWVSQVFPSQ